ncbi:MAG: hypothetical protein ACRDAM_04960, partial [Casimicrobium sp.]
MNQNSNRNGGARHPRSPLAKHATPHQKNNASSGHQRRASSSPAALFTAPPKQARNWLDDVPTTPDAQKLGNNKPIQQQRQSTNNIGQSDKNSNISKNIENNTIAQLNEASG